MPGGLLNIIAYGNQNIILNGNPTKTFFKSVYAKYTNFGLQKYRIDFNGERTLQLNESSKFTFNTPLCRIVNEYVFGYHLTKHLESIF